MENDATIEAAVQAILIQAEQNDELPLVRKPDNWREVGLDLTYPEGHRVTLWPSGDDETRVEVYDREGRQLTSEVLRDYNSPETLADRIAEVFATVRGAA